MKKTKIIGMLVSIMFCSTIMAQNISMTFKNEKLPSAFKRLEKATSYKFVFAYDDVNEYTVTGEVGESSINEVMAYLLKDKPLDYTINGNIVNIKKSDQSSANDKKISGVVLDAGTGEPIIGATVRVAGTKLGVTTDTNGRFSIACPPTA